MAARTLAGMDFGMEGFGDARGDGCADAGGEGRSGFGCSGFRILRSPKDSASALLVRTDGRLVRLRLKPALGLAPPVCDAEY